MKPVSCRSSLVRLGASPAPASSIGVSMPAAARPHDEVVATPYGYRTVVVEPAAHGLAPAPPGYGCYYAGNRFVLAAIATGVIARAVPGGW